MIYGLTAWMESEQWPAAHPPRFVSEAASLGVQRHSTDREHTSRQTDSAAAYEMYANDRLRVQSIYHRRSGHIFVVCAETRRIT